MEQLGKKIKGLLNGKEIITDDMIHIEKILRNPWKPN